jgi:hypothetical protein
MSSIQPAPIAGKGTIRSSLIRAGFFATCVRTGVTAWGTEFCVKVAESANPSSIGQGAVLTEFSTAGDGAAFKAVLLWRNVAASNKGVRFDGAGLWAAEAISPAPTALFIINRIAETKNPRKTDDMCFPFHNPRLTEPRAVPSLTYQTPPFRNPLADGTGKSMN